MATREERLRDKNVDELREQAREHGIPRYSEMRKDELIEALAEHQGDGARRARQRSFAAWVRDRSLGLFFLGLFLASWIGQLVFQWFHFVNEQRDHGETAAFWSGAFWYDFWQATLENWQSEFLQLATFAIAAAYLVYKGSSESPDSDERLEHKVDALLQAQGLDPKEIEAKLPPKYRKT